MNIPREALEALIDEWDDFDPHDPAAADLRALLDAHPEVPQDHDAALIEQARAEGKAEADAAWVAHVEELLLTASRPMTHSAMALDCLGELLTRLRALIPADAATALDQVRAQAKAEGLREAAEHLAGLDGIRWPIEGVNEAYVDWLRGRARRLGGAL